MEGNLDFWDKYIATSHVLDRRPVAATTGDVVASVTRGDLALRDNCQFVYGGDVCDRGKVREQNGIRSVGVIYDGVPTLLHKQFTL